MKKMKKILLIVLVVTLLVGLTGCKKKEKDNFDKYNFREEYMSINGLESSSGKTIRPITISEDHAFVYATAEELVEKIENKESFLVYFGFPTCPWCRSILEQLDKAINDKKIDKIYYVNVLDIRDVREVNENGDIVTTKEGSEGYQKLLTLIGDVLEDYSLTKDGESISAGEKRIYAPNIVAIAKGKAVQMETGISDELTDPYGELTDEIKQYAYNKFKCLIECYEEESTSCQKNMC